MAKNRAAGNSRIAYSCEQTECYVNGVEIGRNDSKSEEISPFFHWCRRGELQDDFELRVLSSNKMHPVTG